MQLPHHFSAGMKQHRADVALECRDETGGHGLGEQKGKTVSVNIGTHQYRGNNPDVGDFKISKFSTTQIHKPN
jgi:hypothetical protein